MKSLIIGKPFEMHTGQTKAPVLRSGEVLVSVAAAGICAGDLYYYTGKNPYATYPQICGHEIAGTVAAAADKANEYLVGKAVVVEPFIACGKCYPCSVGKPNCCSHLQIIGVHIPGGYADAVAVPATNVHEVPAGLPLSIAVLAEPVTIVIQACHRAQVTAQDTVLVLGCGPIGMYLIDVLNAIGAKVLAADIKADRLEAAKNSGAETFPADEKLVENIMSYTNGEGLAVVMEATGVPAVMEQTVNLIAPGGRIVIVGLGKKGEMVQFPALDFTRKELTILGSRTEVGCFPEALQLLANNKIKFAAKSSFIEMWKAPGLFSELAINAGKIHKGVLVRED